MTTNATGQESKAEVSVSGTDEENMTRKLKITGSAVNAHKKTKMPKETLNPNNVQGTAMVIENNSVNESGDSTEKANSAQK